jgi:pyrimidine-specific ribonucleoside hydrolase
LERIIFMGGAISGGNATPVAEFNAWHDPEALRIVLDSEIPTTMYGLDVFEQAHVPATICENLKESGDTRTQLVGRLLAAYAHAQGPLAPSGLGDAGAACLLADPTTARIARLPVSIELSGASRGQTIVDRRARAGESEHHGQRPGSRLIDVVTHISAERMVANFLEAIEMRRAA